MSRLNFDLQQLKAFVAVAQRGSFRAAADHIHLSAPALSRRINKLEGALGILLFNRNTRDVEITAQGKVFLERATSALDDLEQAAKGIGDTFAGPGGRVTVSCMPSAAIHFLPSVLRSFSAVHPDVKVRVIETDAVQVLTGVESGESDVGISFTGRLVPGVHFKPLRSDPFVLAMPIGHPLATRTSASWSEIEKTQLIAVARNSVNRHVVDDALAIAGINPTYRIEVSQVSTVLNMVEAGLGLAAVPNIAISHQLAGLVHIPLREPTITRELGLAIKRGTVLKYPVKEFYDHLHEALAT